MPHGSDYAAPPAPRVVSREEYPLPRGHVLCSCGGVIRLRVSGTVTKHGAWAGSTRNLGACPRSGEAAEDGARL